MVATANLLDTLFRGRRLEDLNPVTTAGSMQVSVRWAMSPRAEPGLAGRRGGGPRRALHPRRRACASESPALGVSRSPYAGVAVPLRRLQRRRVRFPERSRPARAGPAHRGPESRGRRRSPGRLRARRAAHPEDSETLGAFRVFRDQFAPTLQRRPAPAGRRDGQGPELEQSPSSPRSGGPTGSRSAAAARRGDARAGAEEPEAAARVHHRRLRPQRGAPPPRMPAATPGAGTGRGVTGGSRSSRPSAARRAARARSG